MMTDHERERLIESYRRVVVDAPDSKAKRIAALRMRELIAQRSTEQVERMERERGLR